MNWTVKDYFLISKSVLYCTKLESFLLTWYILLHGCIFITGASINYVREGGVKQNIKYISFRNCLSSDSIEFVFPATT